MKDQAILNFLTNNTWVMEPNVLDRMVEIIERHAAGIKLSQEEITQFVAGRENNAARKSVELEIIGDTAVIPITGILAKHASEVNDISSPAGTSIEETRDRLRLALANEAVQRIILQVDSPGGSADGVPDLAQELLKAAGQKPLIAFVENAESGALWLASQASAIFATRAAQVGSIGVYTVIRDTSEAMKRAGINYRVLRTGQYKGSVVPGAELGDLADINQRITSLYELFVADVAAGRGMKVEKLRSIADGRSLRGRNALEAGLIDGIRTFEEVLKDTNRVAARTELAAAASDNQGELEGDQDMDKQTTFSAADVEKAQREAVAENNLRVQKISEILAGHPDLLQQAIADPACTADKAQALLVPKLAAQNVELKNQLKDANDRLSKIAGSGGQPVATTSTDQAEPKPGEAKTAAGSAAGLQQKYEEAVRAKIKAGSTPAKAMHAAGNEMPLAHQAWVNAGCPEIR